MELSVEDKVPVAQFLSLITHFLVSWDSCKSRPHTFSILSSVNTVWVVSKLKSVPFLCVKLSVAEGGPGQSRGGWLIACEN